MTRPLRDRRGTTLVELIVSAALAAILAAAVLVVVRPAAAAFVRTQRLARAQSLADTLTDTLRAELQQARGTLRFADTADPFAAAANADEGDALVLEQAPGYAEILDAAPIDSLYTVEDGRRTDAPEADRAGGYLHTRSLLTALGRDEAAAGRVYTYAVLSPQDGAVGLKIGTLHFKARGWERTGTEKRLTSLEVSLTIVDADGALLCTQQAILPLPGKPVLSTEPEF